MYDPVMRVLTVLEILQARDQVTGAELAERLEVDIRTVQRYIARLQDLCIPVESTRGVGGAYRLKPGYRLPPLMFTDEEAFALSLGLKALRSLGLSAFAPATEGAAAKLGRVLPEPLRESVQSVGEIIALEPGPWVVSTPAESLLRIASAIRMRRRVSFEYQSHSKERSRREVDPYGVAHMDGRWYAVGFCHLRLDIRTFRLDRMSAPDVCDATFERSAPFDIRAYLERAMPFVQSAYAVDVWLDLPFQKARQWFAPHRIRVTEENSGTALSCGRDDLEPFAAMLLSLNCRIVVRNPPELRQAFGRISDRANQAASYLPDPAFSNDSAVERF